MASLEPIDLNQPKNKLTEIAEAIRKQQITKNDYKFDGKTYSQTSPDALSDGDEIGRGTGIFLDTIGGGTSVDIAERKNEIKINKFQSDKPYTFPTV